MNTAHHDTFHCGNPRTDRSCRDRDFYAVLLGMAGHDLRQPLQVLQCTHDWFVRHLDHDLAKMQLAKAQLDRGQHAISLISEQLDRLITAMRLYDQTSNMRLSEIPLGPVLRRIVDENRDLAAHRRVGLRFRKPRTHILSNEVVLEGIIRNLVRNAIKYTPPGHDILIGCRSVGSHVRIDICDTGIGMAPHQVPQAFEAFRRLDNETADGLGLGLFVVRRAVALLGHRIDVRSEVGKGSRFSILARRGTG